MTGRRAGALALAVSLVAASVVAVALAARVPETRDRRLGPTDPSTPIELSVLLRQRHPDGLARFLEAVSDPSSPRFGRFLDATAFGERFGLPAERVSSAVDLLAAAGFEVRPPHPQRIALRLRGSAGLVGSYFGVELVDFERASDGTTYHRPAAAPAIPAELRGLVTAVSGLDTRVMGTTSSVFDIAPDGLKPSDIALAYDIGPLHDLGIRGEGQTIGIFSGATFDPADVAAFDDRYGIEGPPVERVAVNGGSSDTTSNTAGEVALDIQMIRGVAPQAQIVNYEVPGLQNFVQSIADVVDRAIADGIDILSISYGTIDTDTACGQPWLTAAERQRGELSLQAAAAAGMSIFVSSGDAGAYTSQHFSDECILESVSWPASSPWVVAVGGTLLSVREDGTYLEEAGWEDLLQHWGTGGGLSPVDPRPEWQQAPGVDNEVSNGNRQVPDVAAFGDPDSGAMMVFGGQWTRAGGTSASAPFWAGAMLLVDQYAEGEGVEDLGFVTPTLYALASSTQPFPPFHDVVRGGNRLHNCTPGWDYATGLGSPHVWNLARDVVRYLQATP
jgi:kumamolisin